jgi:hypothetical protein
MIGETVLLGLVVLCPHAALELQVIMLDSRKNLGGRLRDRLGLELGEREVPERR